jgi:D-tyrosyl-tRNA(Tyr) deacylase
VASALSTPLASEPGTHRPPRCHAARPERAQPLYEAFCGALEDYGLELARGRFGAYMQVELANDGPVTIVLDG